MEVPGLVEDFVTPVLKLLAFNIILPFIDIYFDIRLIQKLHPQHPLRPHPPLHLHLLCLVEVGTKTSEKVELDISNPSNLAPNEGCPGQANIDICDSGPKSSHIENYRSLVTWHHDITDHFIQCTIG